MQRPRVGSRQWWFAEVGLPGGHLPRLRFLPVMVLVTATWVGILLAYSLLVPLFRAPDEVQHVDLVISSRTSPGYDDYDDTYMDSRIVRGSHLIGRPEVASTGQEAEAIPRPERPTLDELGPATPAGRNQQTQHPPLYYAALGSASTLVTTMVPGEDTWTFDRLVYLLRLMNVALLAPLPGLAYAAARRVGLSVRGGVSGAVLLMAIPQLAHIGSSVNNDNLLVLLASITAVLVLAVHGGDLSRRRAVVLGTVVGLAILTKGTALVLPPMVAVAYLLHVRTQARLALLRLAQCGLVAFVVGGWWLAKNLVQHGSLQPSDPFWLVHKDVDPVVGDWAERFFYLMPVRFWGHFGLLEVKLNRPLIVLGTGLVLVSLALLVTDRRRRSSVGLLQVPVAGALVLVARKTWSRYLTVGRPIPGIQGRYLFIGVVGLVVSVSALLARLPTRVAERSAGAIGVLLVAMHAAAVAMIVRDFWGPEVGPWADRLDDVRAFSPLPARVSDLVLYGAASLVVALVLVLAVDAVRSPSPSPDALEPVT